jgi:2-oxoglutarate-Fe(II)-dependent oxygenase superfamily protein
VSAIAGAQPPFQLTRTGTACRTADVAALRRTFQQQHCIALPGFIEPVLLDRIHRLVSVSAFTEFAHDDLASELLMSDGGCSRVLNFLANDRHLFDFVRAISSCRPIRAFVGRVYRRCPNTDHHDSWHADLVHHRLVGMSVNLSTEPYEGGTFELREAGAKAPIATLPNVGQGDAILFRIDPALEHRVTRVIGTVPKTAFAGWFVADEGREPKPGRDTPS